MGSLYEAMKFSLSICLLLIVLGTINGTSGRDPTDSGLIPKMIGGEPADQGEAPFAVALFDCEKYLCTFSIINDRTIIGAAHCLYDASGVQRKLKNMRGVIGNVDRSKGISIDFQRMIIHKLYVFRTSDYDIATLITSSKLDLSGNTLFSSLGCISLAPTDQTYLGEDVKIYGWGRISREHEERVLPLKLQWMVAAVISWEECNEFWEDNPSFLVSDKHICTKSYYGSLRPGDSGGPVVYRTESGQLLLIGINKAADQEKIGSHYTIFGHMSVSKFSSWIDENSEGDVFFGECQNKMSACGKCAIL